MSNTNYTIYAQFFNIPDPASGSMSGSATASLIDNIPWWATPRIFTKVTHSDNFGDLTASAAVSEAIATGSRYFRDRNGALRTYHSVKGWRNKDSAAPISVAVGKRAFTAQGISGSSGYAGNHLIKETDSGDVVWSSVGEQWEAYKHSAVPGNRIIGPEREEGNPNKRGPFKTLSGSGQATTYPKAPPGPIN